MSAPFGEKNKVLEMIEPSQFEKIKRYKNESNHAIVETAVSIVLSLNSFCFRELFFLETERDVLQIKQTSRQRSRETDISDTGYRRTILFLSGVGWG